MGANDNLKAMQEARLKEAEEAMRVWQAVFDKGGAQPEVVKRHLEQAKKDVEESRESLKFFEEHP
jgi:hypothetical protein